MSRPSKITPAIIELIVEAVRAGVEKPALVASRAGIGERTLYRWQARGRLNRRCRACPCRFSDCLRRAAEAPYAELVERIDEIHGAQQAARIARAEMDAMWHALSRPVRRWRAS